MQHNQLLRRSATAMVSLFQRSFWRSLHPRDCFVIRLPEFALQAVVGFLGQKPPQCSMHLYRGSNGLENFYSTVVADAPDMEDKYTQLELLFCIMDPQVPWPGNLSDIYHAAGMTDLAANERPKLFVKPAGQETMRYPSEQDLQELLLAAQGIMRAAELKLLAPGRWNDPKGLCVLEIAGPPENPTVSATRETFTLPSREALTPAVNVELEGLELLDAKWIIGEVPMMSFNPAGSDLTLVIVLEAATGKLLFAMTFQTQSVKQAVEVLMKGARERKITRRSGIAKQLIFTSRRLFAALALPLSELQVKSRFRANDPTFRKHVHGRPFGSPEETTFHSHEHLPEP